MIESLSFALLYAIVALIVAFVIIALLLYKFRKEKLKDFSKIAIGTIFGVAVTATALLAAATFYEMESEDGFMTYFPAILALVLIALCGGCLMGVASMFNKFLTKIAGAITGLGLLGGFIALMVVLTRYYDGIMATNDPDNYMYQVGQYLEQNALIVSFVVMVLVLVAIYFIGKKREVNDTKALVFGAIAIAMSFALSYVRLFPLPQGGSVTFASLLPLMIYCSMFGTRRGVMVCVIYGFLQALQDTYIIHPLQFMLDYPLAFGMIAASGIFFERTPLKKNKLVAFIVGATIAVVLRYICHILSGTFAFGKYAIDAGYGASQFFYYSLAYNSFTIVDLAIDLAAGILLFLSRAFRRQMDLAVQPAAGAADDFTDDADEDDVNTHDSGSHAEDGEDADDSKGFV